MHLFPFRAFSFTGYIHYAPSPLPLIFIPRLLLHRLYSFRAFSFTAYFHSAPSPSPLIFILRLLLRCWKNWEGTERKCNFERVLWKKKAIFKKVLNYYIATIEELFRVFRFGLACWKKCIVYVCECMNKMYENAHKHIWRILQCQMSKIAPYLC
jgi:hypothetical protein